MKPLPHWIVCRWKPWVDTHSGVLSVEGQTKGHMIEQERRCEVCNKVEMRRSISMFAGSYN